MRAPNVFVEALLLVTVLSLLASQARFRHTVAAAPRALRVGAVFVLTVWLGSQLGEVQLATYPFMSWHMYGETRANAPVLGYRLVGERCDGTSQILPPSGGALGRRPLLQFGLRRAFRDAAEPGGADALARVDSLLAVALTTWNTNPGRTPLCGMAVQQVRIPAESLGVLPFPTYMTVRRHARR